MKAIVSTDVKACMLVLFLTWTIVVGAQQVSKSQMPQVKWTFSITQPLIASPVVNGNTVIFGGLDSTIYALDVSSGSLQWKFKTVGPVRSTAYVSDNQVFFSGGDGRVYCVDAISGKKLWTFATPGGILGERRYDAADYFDSSPVVSDTRVFVGAGDGRLYCLERSTGGLLWSFAAGDIIHTTPVLLGDNLAFGCSDGYLYCVGQDDGRVIWKFKAVGHRNFPRGEMQGSPVSGSNLIFIGSRDYNLYAVDAHGGYAHLEQTVSARLGHRGNIFRLPAVRRNFRRQVNACARSCHRT